MRKKSTEENKKRNVFKIASFQLNTVGQNHFAEQCL